MALFSYTERKGHSSGRVALHQARVTATRSEMSTVEFRRDHAQAATRP